MSAMLPLVLLSVPLEPLQGMLLMDGFIPRLNARDLESAVLWLQLCSVVADWKAVLPLVGAVAMVAASWFKRLRRDAGVLNPSDRVFRTDLGPPTMATSSRIILILDELALRYSSTPMIRVGITALALAASGDVRAGFTDPAVPDEVYKANGLRYSGPYRPRADGKPGFDGGLVSVTTVQVDANGKQIKRSIFSGTIINDYYVATAAHGALLAVQNPTTTTTYIDWSPNCLQRSPSAIDAAEVVMYPGWTKENAANIPDLAIIKLKKPIVEGGMLVQPTFATEPPAQDSVVTLGGYGVAGLSQETRFDDGHPRAGNGVVDIDPTYSFGYSSESYFTIDCNPVSDEAYPVMVGAGGDSGGIVTVKETGAIVGMLIASTRTMPGACVALSLSGQLPQQFIKFVVKPVVPDDFTIERNQSSVTLSWPAGYSGLVLEQSDHLASWTAVQLPRIVEDNRVKVTSPSNGGGLRAFFRLKYQP